MSRLHACHPLTPCPICRARAIETLLETGRAEMALPLARGLAADIAETIGQAMIVTRAQVQGAIRFVPPEPPPLLSHEDHQ